MTTHRRGWLKTVTAAGAAALTVREQRTQDAAARATRGLPSPKIKDVQVIETQPANAR